METSIDTIKIGTIVPSVTTAQYIQKIIKYGFECFEITFGSDATECDLKKMAEEIMKTIDGKAQISAIGIYGNPLEHTDSDVNALHSWKLLIDNAHLFGTDIVSGFTGRIRNMPIERSIPRMKEVFTPLIKRAADKGIKIAFENCDMQGTWENGDWNIAHTPDAWEIIFNELPYENVGLEWEPCHQMAKLIDPMPQLKKWVKKCFIFMVRMQL